MTLLDAAAVEALTRSLMLGTLRQPPPVERATGGLVPAGDGAVLKALALLGQAQRFRRPGAPPRESMPGFPDDPRPAVPDAARPDLLALSGNAGKPDDAVAVVIADVMARRRLKLHPFDLPRLDAFVKAQGEALGASAVAWNERHAAAAAMSPPSPYLDTVDETSWTLARSAQKVAFIRDLRRTAPEHARALIEASFAKEPAPVRVALLRALAPELSTGDQPFLEALARDRAPSVREAAERLMARLPGSAQAAKALAGFLGRIIVARTGRLRWRTTLRLEFPANVASSPNAKLTWAIGQVHAVGIGGIAQGLGVEAGALPDAAAEDPILLQALSLAAMNGGRFDLLAQLVRRAAGEISQLLLRADEMEGWPPERWAAWCRAAIQPELWDELPDSLLLALLPRHMRRPLPTDTARSLLASRAWRAMLDRALGRGTGPVAAETFDNIALLTPPALREALRRDLDPLPLTFVRRAQRTLSLLDMLEAASPETRP